MVTVPIIPPKLTTSNKCVFDQNWENPGNPFGQHPPLNGFVGGCKDERLHTNKLGNIRGSLHFPFL